MPGAGTDHTKEWTALAGPIVVLVEPQLGENIGTAARAMANFGLTRLRLVRPRDAWPNVHARRAASGADAVLDGAELSTRSRRRSPIAASCSRPRHAPMTRRSP